MSPDPWRAAVERALNQPHWQKPPNCIEAGKTDLTTDIMHELWPLIAERAEMAGLLREVLALSGKRVCAKRLGGDPDDKRCAPDAPQPCLGCRIERALGEQP